jgi:hypothetical protein
MAGFPIQPTIYILNRCNQLLKRTSNTDNVKQEYYYWIDWLQKQFKNFHKLNESSKEKVMKNLDKVDKLLLEDIGDFKK